MICGDGKVEVQRAITNVAASNNARLYLMNTDLYKSNIGTNGSKKQVLK